MQYRTFGSKRWKVSVLGFGCMRLPHPKGDGQKIDEPQALEMVRWAIDHGVNYIDTAYVYHIGNSEVVLGKALAGGYRDKVLVATKLPVWNVKTIADCDRLLGEQLDRLQMDHIDFYLLHCLQQKSWPEMRDLDVGVGDFGEGKGDGQGMR